MLWSSNVKTLLLIFGIHGRVGKGLYASVGFGLMLLKYLVEALAIFVLTGFFFDPISFVIPSFTLRQGYYAYGPDWFPWAVVVWSLPFVWIAVTLSVRRAIDAEISPLWGLLVIVPVVNLFAMIYLAILPTSKQHSLGSVIEDSKISPSDDSSFHPLDNGPEPSEEELFPDNSPPTYGMPRVGGGVTPVEKIEDAKPSSDEKVKSKAVYSAVLGVVVGGVFAIATTAMSVYTMHNYGGSLFLGMPLVTSAVAGYIFNQPRMGSLPASMGVGCLSILMGGLGLLLFAMEGVICLVMATPLILPLGALGGALGWLFAKTVVWQSRWMLGGAFLIVPLLTIVEQNTKTYEIEICESSVIVDATPDEVWNNVVSFPDITEPPAWYFRLGVASPLRARIIGSGVGAVRYCEFTTGSFVEPITVWEKPNRLSFDVTDQPDPLVELTPYRDIRPPHLQHSFRSVRGEFELIELADGQTKLIGRTWYTVDMGPRLYWRFWTNEIIHRIHLRVLEHIRENAESGSNEETVDESLGM